jgi:hypothetical protein
MAIKTLPSRALLHQLLRYDAETGDLIWLPRSVEMFATKHRHAVWTTKHCGKVAGYIRRPVKGPAYRFIRIGAAQYQTHRLVWLHVHGGPVPDLIDHQDRDPLNNRLRNLRAATYAQNRANSRPSTKLGVKGVYARGRRFCAMAGKIYLGTFTTIDEAAAAYKTAADSLFGEFSRSDHR